jgi:hypothetical protein
MVRLLLLLFVVCLAILIAAMLLLPAWGFLLALVGVFLLVMLVLNVGTNRITTSLFMIPFKAKGAVLRKASAEVHSVEAAEAPSESRRGEHAGDGKPPAREEPREYYRVDVTITPRPALGRFKHWEPGELLVVPYGAKVTANDDTTDASGPETLEVFENGRFGPDEGYKYFGPQRLRMLVSVPPGAPRRLKFRYYLEAFGDVRLPQVP